jgi:hypothetical protein
MKALTGNCLSEFVYSYLAKRNRPQIKEQFLKYICGHSVLLYCIIVFLTACYCAVGLGVIRGSCSSELGLPSPFCVAI